MTIDLARLQRKLGHEFSDTAWLLQAVTHRSYGATNNERLEFLGDSILSFVITEDLYGRFEEATEGKLSRLRARLVKRQTLAELARELGLGDFLVMGSGELKSGGFDRESILADAVEAIIGAVFLDAGMAACKQFVLAIFEQRLESLSLDGPLKDAKSRLQELLQGRQEPLPDYEVARVTGEAHDQFFMVECRIEPLSEPIVGQGSSRRQAEQDAASKALVAMGVEHEHP